MSVIARELIPVGTFVTLGGMLPAAADDRLAGVAMPDSAKFTVGAWREQPPHVSGDVMAVVSAGRVWVRSETRASLGDPVHVRFAGDGPQAPPQQVELLHGAYVLGIDHGHLHGRLQNRTPSK